MKLIYENNLGKVIFYGGGTGTVRLTAVSGLTFPDREAETVRYPREAGQTVVSLSVLPRTITAAGDIRRVTGREVGFVSLVLSMPGKLTVENKRSVRTADARCVSFIPEKPKGIYIPFTLQFICDYPYFSDKSKQRVSVMKRIPRLTSPFTFPCVFSNRVSEGTLLNRGSVPVYPKIELFSTEDALCEKGIHIKNQTTGAEILLNCSLQAGETVTVDCKNRTVVGSVQGNLIHTLSPDTLLSSFFLERGLNRLTFSIPDESAFVTATAIFHNQYGEAIE